MAAHSADTLITLPISDGDLLNEERNSRRLAEMLKLPFVDVKELHIETEILASIPAELFARYSFIPVSDDGERLTIVTADPTDVKMLDDLEVYVRKPLNVLVGLNSQIQDVLKKTESDKKVLDEVSEDLRLQIVREDAEEGEEVISLEKLSSDSSPIVKLVDFTVYNALQKRASDIHIETGDMEVQIKYRVDGVLYPALEPIDKRFHSTIISRIKVMAELDIAEKRIPQDGRFKLKVKGKNIDFRVSVIPTIHGEDCVIRILDKESTSEEFKNLSLDVLGFEPEIKKKIRRHAAEPYGMLLVTGPTGSGKTTTLYAVMSEIQSPEFKMITIEDPVEYQLRGVTQIPVNEKKGLTFARGLRSVLRHDPDKIMVGEIRDEETANIAIQSALTGHLVFTTVHANNVVDVLGRFLNMKVEPYNFVSALNCVLAQRLVRKICPACRQLVDYPDEVLRESNIPLEMARGRELYEGRGCIECNGTGYRGRMAISEVLELSDKVREYIIARKPSSEIKKVARDEGMVTLRESAVKAFLQGATGLKEINKVTFIDEAMK
ncbi:MAG TPA: GspE/PulE family protein [Acidobacteriota bacterium]|jgi:type IV pilus assembly protein PilB|nr:GspE/PulE family protein [Acidobacteriota bacterium]HNT17115.1 GspE/PulE family protein [Acidobacteriota bacterium]HPA26127.1 GspE/PulE family protein [Acidobacteriota bacterium]HQO19240.1 GspE/PulE family protein [Acidobacteriota bacterium]HQQ46052.1 GspE/PulE family protein [Acidobacteriota bacterium]